MLIFPLFLILLFLSSWLRPSVSTFPPWFSFYSRRPPSLGIPVDSISRELLACRVPQKGRSQLITLTDHSRIHNGAERSFSWLISVDRVSPTTKDRRENFTIKTKKKKRNFHDFVSVDRVLIEKSKTEKEFPQRMVVQTLVRFMENKWNWCSVEPDDEICHGKDKLDILQCDGDGQTDTE